MTKLTKNEKILRKGNEKWKNFLAEGAFKKTLNESIDFRKVHFAADMEPEELELLNIPEEEYKTKSKEEVEAIKAALKKAHDRSQHGVWGKYPKTATYDENEPILRLIGKKLKVARALTGEKGYYHSSGPEEDEEYRMTYSNDMPSRSGEDDLSEGGTMGEYGKMDAEQGLPPTKIGRGNEEYMAAYNAVLQARGEEPLDMQQPDQAYLDALRSGQLEETVRKIVAKVLSEKKTFKVGEFVRIVGGSLKGATGKILEPVTTMKGEEGFAIELYSDAKMKVFGQRGDEVIATADEMESGGTTDGMELYDIDEKLSAADKEFHKSVMDKGKVPNLKGDMGPIPGLEGPFQYRSGAVLYYDPKAGKYYDRGKDMYLDNDEASRLIMEKDEKEFAKIFARAKDMLVLSARSRVPVSLKSVQSALDVIKMPSEMEKGKLIVKNEYVIADKNELPESAKQISFTKYAMDYLSNLPGEQLDLPME